MLLFDNCTLRPKSGKEYPWLLNKAVDSECQYQRTSNTDTSYTESPEKATVIDYLWRWIWLEFISCIGLPTEYHVVGNCRNTCIYRDISPHCKNCNTKRLVDQIEWSCVLVIVNLLTQKPQHAGSSFWKYLISPDSCICYDGAKCLKERTKMKTPGKQRCVKLFTG